MSKLAKLKQRVSTKPTPSDITWDELVTLLTGLGYRQLNGNGSRRRFYNQEIDRAVFLHQPHPTNVVGKAAVDDVVQHLKDNSLL